MENMNIQFDPLCYKNQQEILLRRLVEQYEQLIEQTRDNYKKGNISMFNVQQITDKSKFSIVITHNILEIRTFQVNLKFKTNEDLFQIIIIASKLSKDNSSQNKQNKIIDKQQEIQIQQKPTNESVSQQIQQNTQQSFINNCNNEAQSQISQKNNTTCLKNEKDKMDNQLVDTNFEQIVKEDIEQIVFEKNIPVSSNKWGEYFVIATERKIEIQFSQNQMQV